MAYGTLTISDLLATTQQTVIDIGEDKVFQAVDDALAAHNMLLQDKYDLFVERGTEKLRRYGGNDTMTMEYADEVGDFQAQKITAGQNIGFPLRFAGAAVQWDRHYFRRKSAKEFAKQFVGIQDADVRNLDLALRRAIFTPTNANFIDKLVDEVVLPVKAFLNADGVSIPLGPNGEAFNGATHTHYVGRVGGSLAASDVSALIENVTEHGNIGEVVLLINRSQESTVRSFTPNFTPYIDARVIAANTATVAAGTLSMKNLYDRAIGVFDQAEVWVKPWIPAGYMIALLVGSEKPLYMREPNNGPAGLQLLADNETFPLRAQRMGREFGFGVWQRQNAAVLYTGGTSYVMPTLTS